MATPSAPDYRHVETRAHEPGQFPLALRPEHVALRLTIRHVRRWLIHRHQVGTGHVYQGRYKSLAMQADGHLSTVCRYVERNPLRAHLVERSAAWPWSSAGQGSLPPELRVDLSPPPMARRKDWVQWVDQPQTPAEEEALRRCVRRATNAVGTVKQFYFDDQH